MEALVTRRLPLQVVVAALAALALYAVASPAYAATVAVVPDIGIQFVAAPGEVNDITTSFDSTTGLIRIADAGAGLTAGAGCTPDGLHAAICLRTSGTIELGDGDDEATLSAGDSFTLNGGDGDDTLDADQGGRVVNGGAGNDHILGGHSGGSIISSFRNGGPGDDVIDAENTPATLDGGPGADTFKGAEFTPLAVVYTDRDEPVFVDIGEGVGDDGELGEGDTVGAGIDVVEGGSDDDVLIGSSAYWEHLIGNGGDDLLDGGDGGNDTASGGDGDDLLVGDPGTNDRLVGGGGIDFADYSARTASVFLSIGMTSNDGENLEADSIESDIEGLIGGAAGDVLTGGYFDNFLFGGAGFDQLSGDFGDDLLIGGSGGDTLGGGAGFDTSDYSERTNAVFVDLDGVYGDDGELGEGDSTADDVEDIRGGDGNDVLTGNGSENFLYGFGGNDSLDGGTGPDLLVGGAGDDNLGSRDGFIDENDCGTGGGDRATMDWFDAVFGCEQGLGPAPDAATGGATEITQTAARLSGAVNPLGNATAVYWELGPTSGYGTRTANVNLGANAGSSIVSAAVAGLAPGTTYHYRVVATNGGGMSYGIDRTFSTAAAPPPPIRPPAAPLRRCVVARVVGKPLRVARRLITKRRCRVGKITRRPSRVVRAGIVLAQRPKAGKRLPRGSKVALVVSSGKARKRGRSR